ncbi:sialate O-acetylesterase [Pedobacter sp. LMG 31464]|uniref:Sialate O-acetylesterase n=1 Tax=Pedobacter planticolens TaxID=2679964 RepID=A0A923DX37_9SPHI|nr:GDSL-type esterase/lipase family protein [Pedobacter planticolens]MBB2144700.1 sialate O-acetylesterase [Pedobacter planticolens]
MKFIAKISFLILINCLPFVVLAQIKVACIGNSVTAGYGLSNPSKNSYPSQLQQLLGDKYVVGNFGHSGATLLKKGHNPYYKTKEFTDALNFKADIVIIHLGLNDTDPRNWPNFKNEFESDYSWLIDTLKKQNPNVKVFICQLTPIFSGHSRFKSGTRDWYDQIQQTIPQISKANQTRLINLSSNLYNRPDLFADNLHPNAEGAALIAQNVYQNLTGDFGQLKLATVFTDHMVLQRLKPIPIYGTATAGEEIEVQFQKKILTTITDLYGNWKAVFPASKHGGPFVLSVKTKKSTLNIKDILIGDVWLCSGQSNMDFKLKSAKGGKEEIKKNPLLRLYKLNAIAETDNTSWDSLTLAKTNQLEFFSGNWQQADSSSLQNFSAVGYYFGKKLTQEEKVPIGLIQVSVGGSGTESWIDRYTLEHDDLLVDMVSNWRKTDFIQQWCRERADLNLKNATSPLQRHPYQPCYNYEAGINPLTKFPINGVIWYQGESNANNIELHEHLFKTLVKNWRSKWNINLPFYYVQLSSIDRPSWPEFRNSQRLMANELTNVGMAVSSDLGDSLNVHPTNKQPVGERLARLALKYTYKKDIKANGPEAIKAVQVNNQVQISFANAIKLAIGDQKDLNGFELVNEKGQRFNVKATIHNLQVWLTIPKGEKVKKVVYAWQPFTRANLVNEAQLPASTFSMNIK